MPQSYATCGEKLFTQNQTFIFYIIFLLQHSTPIQTHTFSLSLSLSRNLSTSSLIFSPSLKPVARRLEQGWRLWWFISFSPWVFSLCISHASVRLWSIQTGGDLITWVFMVILPFYVMHNLEKKFSSNTMHSSKLQINFVHSGNDQNCASVTFNIILKIPIEIHKKFKST